MTYHKSTTLPVRMAYDLNKTITPDRFKTDGNPDPDDPRTLKNTPDRTR